MGFTPPNQTITGRHVGHSSQPSPGTPAGRGAAPTGDRFRGAR